MIFSWGKDSKFLKVIFVMDGIFREYGFSPNSVFNTWGSYGNGKRPGG